MKSRELLNRPITEHGNPVLDQCTDIVMHVIEQCFDFCPFMETHIKINCDENAEVCNHEINYKITEMEYNTHSLERCIMEATRCQR
jgi:hypothetical protein